MRKFFLSILGLMIVSGCAGTAAQQVRTTSELKYKKILVMPFTKGGEANASWTVVPLEPAAGGISTLSWLPRHYLALRGLKTMVTGLFCRSLILLPPGL